MRALVTADTVGGVWTYTRELVTGLTRRGVEVTLVSFGEIPTPKQSEWLDALKNVDYRATAFKLEWMQDAEDDLKASSEFLLEVVAETKPDVLHLNQYCYGALDVDLPKIVVAHSDVVSWWRSVHGKDPDDTAWIRFYRNIVSAGLQRATTVVAPSRWMLNAIEENYVHPQNGRVIYNGRNPGLFNPHSSKEDLLVSVGRLWDKAKQVSLLAQRQHNLPVWIAGSERHPDRVQNCEQLQKETAGIRLCGEQSENQLCQLFSRASLYAATSQYEPFGLALVEAALSRCAIIANDIPSFREVWGDSVLYFQRNDAKDLADQIEKLRRDRGLRLKYANLAYHRAKARFSAERMVSEYLSLYKSLIPVGAAVA
jgi:glycogen(starch) synthase